MQILQGRGTSSTSINVFAIYAKIYLMYLMGHLVVLGDYELYNRNILSIMAE